MKTTCMRFVVKINEDVDTLMKFSSNLLELAETLQTLDEMRDRLTSIRNYARRTKEA